MTARALTPTLRARRHVVWIVLLYLAQVLLGLAMVWPLALMVRSTYAAHPLGDRVLFADGALELVDFVARELPTSLSALEGHATVILLLAATVRVVLFGATLAALAFRFDGTLVARVGAALRLGISRFGALAAQSIAALVAQGIMVAFALAAVTGVSSALADRLGAPDAGRAGLLAGIPLALIAFFIGTIRDVAGARVIVDETGTLRSIALAFRAVARKPIFFLEAGWRAATGALLVIGAGAVASRIGGRPGAALFFLFIAHQTVIAMRVALRVSWLAAVIRRQA